LTENKYIYYCLSNSTKKECPIQKKANHSINHTLLPSRLFYCYCLS